VLIRLASWRWQHLVVTLNAEAAFDLEHLFQFDNPRPTIFDFDHAGCFLHFKILAQLLRAIPDFPYVLMAGFVFVTVIRAKYIFQIRSLDEIAAKREIKVQFLGTLLDIPALFAGLIAFLGIFYSRPVLEVLKVR